MENTGVRLWEILDKMLYAIFVRFLHLKFLEKRWDGFMQFVKFGVGEKRSPWKALLKTYISYGFTGIILSNILSYVWIRVFGISKYLAPLINLVVSIPVNFLMNKLWAFKGEKTEA